MIGDGGFAGFDAEKPGFRFHTFTGASVDVNFSRGDIGKWIWTADAIAGVPGRCSTRRSSATRRSAAPCSPPRR